VAAPSPRRQTSAPHRHGLRAGSRGEPLAGASLGGDCAWVVRAIGRQDGAYRRWRARLPRRGAGARRQRRCRSGDLAAEPSARGPRDALRRMRSTSRSMVVRVPTTTIMSPARKRSRTDDRSDDQRRHRVGQQADCEEEQESGVFVGGAWAEGLQGPASADQQQAHDRQEDGNGESYHGAQQRPDGLLPTRSTPRRSPRTSRR
jgi:hypothetical protein